MHQLTSLRTDRLNQPRVAMPQRTNGNAHTEIQIFPTSIIANSRALSLDKCERETAVGGHDVVVEYFGCVHFQARMVSGKGGDYMRGAK